MSGNFRHGLGRNADGQCSCCGPKDTCDVALSVQECCFAATNASGTGRLQGTGGYDRTEPITGTGIRWPSVPLGAATVTINATGYPTRVLVGTVKKYSIGSMSFCYFEWDPDCPFRVVYLPNDRPATLTLTDPLGNAIPMTRCRLHTCIEQPQGQANKYVGKFLYGFCGGNCPTPPHGLKIEVIFVAGQLCLLEVYWRTLCIVGGGQGQPCYWVTPTLFTGDACTFDFRGSVSPVYLRGQIDWSYPPSTCEPLLLTKTLAPGAGIFTLLYGSGSQTWVMTP
jgi:hypothetical protein